mmetsp:Transcript_14797/g.16867  ORF Transcript_14797/g.16867 Transcript_14797/m.16867 type:complete len:374 (+) Transcript_14797:144-1265(+)
MSTNYDRNQNETLSASIYENKLQKGKDLLKRVPSLINLPSKWQKTLTLKQMKEIATRANFHSSWQKIHSKSQLKEYLKEKSNEYNDFLQTIRRFTFDEYLEMGINNVRSNNRSKKRRKKNAALATERMDDSNAVSLKLGIRPALEASVHIIPSGSGVHLGQGLILTCAHCVTHDDYGDDDDDRDDLKIGRIVELVNAKGETFGSVCIQSSSSLDVALLQIPKKEYYINLGALNLAKEMDEHLLNGLDIFALGNPCDIDLEACDEDDERSKRKNKRNMNRFNPFHVSQGKLTKRLSVAEAKAKGLGRQIHSAWTYWGHSGCPLVSVRNIGGQISICIVGIHNSWDDRNGNRHCVPVDEILHFVHSTFNSNRVKK